MTAYEIVTDPETGIGFEYRRWGNAQMDKGFEVVEVNYGVDQGEASALMRITEEAE